MATKYSAPPSATGTPNRCEYELVVTFWQLTVALSGQANVVEDVKCSTVR